MVDWLQEIANFLGTLGALFIALGIVYFLLLGAITRRTSWTILIKNASSPGLFVLYCAAFFGFSLARDFSDHFNKTTVIERTIIRAYLDPLAFAISFKVLDIFIRRKLAEVRNTKI